MAAAPQAPGLPAAPQQLAACACTAPAPASWPQHRQAQRQREIGRRQLRPAAAPAAAPVPTGGPRRLRAAVSCRAAPPAGSETHVQREQRGEWILTFNTGYVEQAVAISRLLADTFVAVEFPEELMDAAGAPLASPATVLQYQLKLLAALQWRASTLGRRFVTISAADAESGQLAGVANVAPGMTLAEAEGHVKLGPEQAAATLSNMAVAPHFRRRGLGRILLQAAEQAALEFEPPTTLMALAVYKYNDAAQCLYESAGYAVDETWIDQRWAELAERGRVGGARRQLMLKELRAQ